MSLKSSPMRISNKISKSSLRYIDRFGRGRPPGWEAIRERVFKRDGFLCRKCKEDDNILTPVLLHSRNPYSVGYCDHYVPEDQGGTDDEINLWCLCKRCHDGKTGKDSTGQIVEPRDMGVYESGFGV